MSTHAVQAWFAPFADAVVVVGCHIARCLLLSCCRVLAVLSTVLVSCRVAMLLVYMYASKLTLMYVVDDGREEQSGSSNFAWFPHPRTHTHTYTHTHSLSRSRSLSLSTKTHLGSPWSRLCSSAEPARSLPCLGSDCAVLPRSLSFSLFSIQPRILSPCRCCARAFREAA